MIGNRQRIVDEDHHSVARVMLERSAMVGDDLTHLAVVFTQDLEHFLGLGLLGELR